MDPAHWQRLNELFHVAIGLAAEERRTWLETTCSGDSALLEEVERLVRAHDCEGGSIRTHEVPDTPALPSMHGQPPIDRGFQGTERFTVRRTLGVGGMGVVHEVHDRVRDQIVALKTLRRTSAAEIYRLKREFRSLADVAHPNLVSLYELFVEGEQCFFTMELVQGVTFVEYVRGRASAPSAPSNATTMLAPAATTGQTSAGSMVRPASVELTPASPFADRLGHALTQLVDGVSELHRRGKLHRDIKPSNVLVTPEGRVVILDFGLIAELWSPRASTGEPIAGTPAYMSPEQLQGLRTTEASDWYSVGVTVYEAITGQLPVTGTFDDILKARKYLDPPAPIDVAPHVPADLSSICTGLLCRDPQRRLSGPGALLKLGRVTATVSASIASAFHMRDVPFVGRERQLTSLQRAFEQTKRGRTAAVYVCGPSGIGKSALVRSFVEAVASREAVALLSGRCYEHESVPYKAFDGVVDSLTHFLTSLPGSTVKALLPSDVRALSRLFPVMMRVNAIATMPRQEQDPPDPLMLRRRAFAALRQLLAGIAALRPLVISIDDLHWADADSAILLEELLRPPGSPAALIVACIRSEELGAKPFLRSLLEPAGLDGTTVLPVAPMTDDEAGELIGSLIPPESPVSQDEKLKVSREAQGNPFFLEELARYVAVNQLGDRDLTLAEMLERRLSGLPEGARPFLETLAVCGRPLAPPLVHEAAGLSGDERPLVASLRSARFIRSSGSAERIEIYHDRIREALAARMAPEDLRRVHGLMAQTLVARRIDDPDALVEHYLGAGDRDRASVQSGLAAAKANAALAFDRAAFFYRRALELAPGSAANPEWKEGLADALANAGRPAEAAEAYLEAAAGAEPSRRVELQRRGAEQFFTGGHIDRGLDLIRTVLAGVGVRMHESPRAALLSLLWQRARLRWRGLRVVSRPAGGIEPDTRLRIDTCWAVTRGLALVDVISGSALSAQHLLMALDAGEPYRLARAMAIEAAVRSAHPTDRKLSERLIEQSKALAESAGNPDAIAVCLLADGIIATMMGEWKKALTSSEQALAILRDKCVGLTWEMNIAQNLAIWALMYLGELAEVSRQVPALLADARSRGNLYLATELCTRSNYVWLAADDPDGGERETVEAVARWSHKGFHRQHYSAMLARVQTALYRGNGEAAWRLLDEQETMFRRSLLTRVQLIRIESCYLRARSALAIAASNRSASRRFLSVARAGARRIARERMPWSDPIALLLEAAIAHIEGSPAVALRLLHDAADRFDRADMKLYAAVARRRIGALQDDAAGRELRRQAGEWMAAQNISNPASMTRMLAPGFTDDLPRARPPN